MPASSPTFSLSPNFSSLQVSISSHLISTNVPSFLASYVVIISACPHPTRLVLMPT